MGLRKNLYLKERKMNKLIELPELKKIREQAYNDEKKIVFTNGCFDLIHAGHVTYLEEAKELGDILVLGLNSDYSVKKIKGEKRPILLEKDRIKVLSALESINYIIIFDSSTPYNLIKEIKPDILVKGGDWKIEDIVGYDLVIKNNGIVRSLSLVKGVSTTDIIEKIRRNYC